MDTYSNILFVKEAFAPLSHLAHRLAVTDKYTPEACCVIGNYYSLKVSRDMTPTVTLICTWSHYDNKRECVGWHRLSQVHT
jgi:hypothetical protein